MGRPLLIGIAGGSGSGKSHFASSLRDALGPDKVSLLAMDQYFRSDLIADRDPKGVNFDHPSHLDLRLMMRQIRALRAGKAVHAPLYDFATMTQTPRACVIKPAPIVLVEGLFILAQPIVDLLDLTCFLNVAADERLLGRILRDTEERNASVHEVIDRYQRFVRPSYQIFIHPTMQSADVVVDFTYRREFFRQMVVELIEHHIDTPIDIDSFVEVLRAEGRRKSIRSEDGGMPLTTDLFLLAKTYPAVSEPTIRARGNDRQKP